jgi:hypothetical protein
VDSEFLLREVVPQAYEAKNALCPGNVFLLANSRTVPLGLYIAVKPICWIGKSVGQGLVVNPRVKLRDRILPAKSILQLSVCRPAAMFCALCIGDSI